MDFKIHGNRSASDFHRQYESKVFYDPAEQVSSLLHTPQAGSSVAESANHYVYDAAGNIASKQVEKPGLAATMTTFGSNTLNGVIAHGLTLLRDS